MNIIVPRMIVVFTVLMSDRYAEAQRINPPTNPQEQVEVSRKNEQELRVKAEDMNRTHATAERARNFPDFLKTVDAFIQTSNHIETYGRARTFDRNTTTQLSKASKQVESQIDRMWRYLDARERPRPIGPVLETASLPERLQQFNFVAARISHRLDAFVDSERRDVVDLQLTSELSDDFNTLKAIARSLRR